MLTVHRELLNMLSIQPVKPQQVRTTAADIAVLMGGTEGEEEEPRPIPSSLMRRQLPRRSASLLGGIVNAAEAQMLVAREKLHKAFSR
jgi:hypothetical protein